MPVYNIDTTITSTYDFKMHEWNNDLSGLQLQIDEDKELLEQYQNNKSETISIGTQIKNEILSALTELERTKAEMEAELESFALGMLESFLEHANSQDVATEMFNMIFDPFIAALDPLMEVVGSVGLPEVPIIGNLKTIIQKIAKTGQIISKLPKEVREAARKEAEAQKNAEKAAAESEKALRQDGMSWWERQVDDFENSPFGKVCKEIVEIFKQIVDIIIMICQCAAMAALMMLLEKLKPILNALGDIIAIISNVQTVMRMLLYSSAQMIKYFYKMLEEKLTDLWNIVRYVIDGGWSLPVNGMISAIHADMLCCEFEMSSINYQKDQATAEHTIELDEETIKKLQIEYDDASAQMKLAQESQDVPAANAWRKQKRKISDSKMKANIVKIDDEIKLSAIELDIKDFDDTKSEKYELELEKRCAEDKALTKSHIEIQNAITDAKIRKARAEMLLQAKKDAEAKIAKDGAEGAGG